MKQKTWPALELFKAIAIVAMVINHSWGRIIVQEELSVHKDSFTLQLANGLHALLFFNIWIPALAASSLRLQSELDPRQRSHSLPQASLALKWALILWLSGYVFAFFTKESVSFFSYNALHFLGLSFFLLSFITKFISTRFFWTLSFAFVVLSLLVSLFKQQILTEPWIFPYFSPDSSFLESLKIFSLEIFFGSPRSGWSIFPWFSLCLIGYALADTYIKQSQNLTFFKTLAATSFLGGIATLLLPPSLNFISQQDVSGELLMLLMPFSLFLSISLGYVCFLSLFSVFYKGPIESLAPLVNAFSRGSFWIFFLQFPIISSLSIPFENLPFSIKLFLFPFLVVLWCFGVGLFVMELSKKQLTIKIRKDG